MRADLWIVVTTQEWVHPDDLENEWKWPNGVAPQDYIPVAPWEPMSPVPTGILWRRALRRKDSDLQILGKAALPFSGVEDLLQALLALHEEKA